MSLEGGAPHAGSLLLFARRQAVVDIMRRVQTKADVVMIVVVPAEQVRADADAVTSSTGFS